METVLPTFGQARGIERNALGVVAVALVEAREHTDLTVHLLGALAVPGVAQPSEVDLHRHRRRGREVVLVIGAEDGL